MKSLAREFGRSGTTANTVSLGLVETPHDKESVSYTHLDVYKRQV